MAEYRGREEARHGREYAKGWRKGGREGWEKRDGGREVEQEGGRKAGRGGWQKGNKEASKFRDTGRDGWRKGEREVGWEEEGRVGMGAKKQRGRGDGRKGSRRVQFTLNLSPR